MRAKIPRDPGILPSRPDPLQKIAKRIVKALEPKGPLAPLEDMAKKAGRPTDTPRKPR